MHAAVGQSVGKSLATDTNGAGTIQTARLQTTSLQTARLQTASAWSAVRQRLLGTPARRQGECPRCGSRNVTEHFYDTDPETGRSVRVYPGPERHQEQGASFRLPYALVVTGLLIVSLLLDRQLGAYSVAHLPVYALGLLSVLVTVVWSMRRATPKAQYQMSFDCHACRYSAACD